MVEKLSTLIQLLNSAKEGDPTSLQLLRLKEGFLFKSPSTFDPETGQEQMKDDLCDLIHFAAAVRHCQLSHGEKVIGTTVSYAMFVYQTLFGGRFEDVIELQGDDVAGEILEVVKDICSTTDMFLKANTLEQKRLSETSDDEGDTGDRDDGNDAYRSDQDEQSEGEEIEDEEGQVKEKNAQSRHLDRKCLVGKGCVYYGPNLKRHLRNVHLKKNEISEQDVGRFFHMGVNPKKRRGPPIKTKPGKKSKGRWRRWCPQPNCGYLGAYLADHLQNKHRMKAGGTAYKLSLKVAKRYMGMEQELQSMVRPEPPIAEIRLPSPASNRSTLEEDACHVEKPKAERPQVQDLASDIGKALALPTPETKPHLSSNLPTSRAETTACPASNETPAADETPVPDETPGSDEVPATNEVPAVDDAPASDVASEDDDEIYPSKADYFNEEHPSTKRHIWLVAYFKYLFTPAAGFHQDKNRLQHACQVRTILRDIDPSGEDILVLAEEEGNKVWLDWVMPNLKNKAAGTLKSYLTSLQKFLEFVTKKGPRPHLPNIDTATKDLLFDLAGSLKGWRRCITKETSSEKWEKYLSECDSLLTSQDVEEIMNSQPAVEGRRAIIAADRARSSQELNLQQYGAARDLLLVSLTRAVGTRPGALENATVGMFEKAGWDAKKRNKVMFVPSHKREEDGPAPIPMDPDTVFLMRVFVEKLRPLVTRDKDPSSRIFLKSDGAPYQKGTIGRRISVFIVKSGIRADKAISATDFRKWIVTEMKRNKRQGQPIDEDLLRRLMCHSDKTAKQWYLRESLTEEAAEASEQIALHTRVSLTEKGSPAKNALTTGYQFPKDSNDDSDKPPPQAQPTDTLTPYELESVSKLFRADIREKISPRKKRVVSLMKTDAVLRKAVHSDPKIQQIIDRVRYLIESQPSLDPFEAPVEEEPSARKAKYVLSRPSMSIGESYDSGRMEWTEEESKAIEKALKPFEKVPRNTEIVSLFQSTQKLQKIYRENNFDRIRNKVKNIFQKRRNR